MSERKESTGFPDPVGMGDSPEEVQAAVAAQVSMLVLGMRVGQGVVARRFDDDREMFRVMRRRVEVTDEMIERAVEASPHTPEPEIREILRAVLGVTDGQ